MIVIIEIDRHWAGIGIDWMQYIKGFRLGFFAIHFISSTLGVLVKAYREEPEAMTGEMILTMTED